MLLQNLAFLAEHDPVSKSSVIFMHVAQIPLSTCVIHCPYCTCLGYSLSDIIKKLPTVFQSRVIYKITLKSSGLSLKG